jgi:hypothetical protein
MSSNLIIGLIGVKGSGKTTAADYIKRKIKNGQVVSFADKLKQTCVKITGLPFEHFEQQNLKESIYDPKFLKTSEIVTLLTEFNIDAGNTNALEQFSGVQYTSNRQLMQILGTDILRNIDRNIHIKNVLNRQDNLIIPDVRFENEAIEIDANGGYLVYIQNKDAESNLSLTSHRSESEVIEKTRFKSHYNAINNGQDLESFYNELDSILFDIAYYKQL